VQFFSKKIEKDDKQNIDGNQYFISIDNGKKIQTKRFAKQ